MGISAASEGIRGLSPVLFISDLHLAPERDRISEIFLRFLRDEARAATALYILGDLFDYWIGDDDLDEPLHRAVVAGLRELSGHGCGVYFMHGNRDFLIGEAFAQAAGIRMLQDPTVVELFGARTLLMHGDTLCTEDVEYQRYRMHVRAEPVQRVFLAKPLAERRAIAVNLQRESELTKEGKAAQIMDVTAAAVEEALRLHACRRLIHGHTHRPARHALVVDNRECERWVLADWYASGECLRLASTGLTRIALA